MKRDHCCAATSAFSLLSDRYSLLMADTNDQAYSGVLKNVIEAADARQKQARKRSLCVINEYFEPVFNAAAATQIVFQHPDRYRRASLKIWSFKQKMSKIKRGANKKMLTPHTTDM